MKNLSDHQQIFAYYLRKEWGTLAQIKKAIIKDTPYSFQHIKKKSIDEVVRLGIAERQINNLEIEVFRQGSEWHLNRPGFTGGCLV